MVDFKGKAHVDLAIWLESVGFRLCNGALRCAGMALSAIRAYAIVANPVAKVI